VNVVNRALQHLASTRPGTWIFLNVFPHIDRRLLRLTRGRLSVAVGQPVLLLTTTGARSGQPRTTPLMFMREGDDVVLIASAGGSTRNPAWYYNLRAHPEAAVTLGGRTLRCKAREAGGAERDALWNRACEFYVGFSKYQKRAGERRVPVMILSPLAGEV